MTASAIAEQPATGQRVVSLDQFRGYTVVGMILVNCIGGYAVVHSVFKHNDTYFSYADSIMPGFHFAVGCSYRLTFLRRLQTDGAWATYWQFLRRGISLILIALLFFGAGGGFPGGWLQFQQMPAILAAGADASPDFATTFVAQWRIYLAHLLKSQMWNTFAIIGATQLVILPWMQTSTSKRVMAMVLFALGHAGLTAWFNWGFVLGDPANWMVRLWKTGTAASWDGGFFGPLCWAVPMLAGTVAMDLVLKSESRVRLAARLLSFGCALMVIGYGLSCLTRLYDVKYGVEVDPALLRFAQSPIVPNGDSVSQRDVRTLLAEPPFVAPPPASERLGNYWMMSKQLPTLSFITFAAGFSAALFSVFVYLCDVLHWQWSVFRTFGMNPLAAYVIHGIIGQQLGPLVPNDSPLWYCLLGLTVYGFAVYACVRALERSHIYIRV